MSLPQVQRTGFEAYLPRMDLSMVTTPSRGVFYQTPLNAVERAGFEAWRSQLPRYQQGTSDYDLQGYYKTARNGTDPRATLTVGPYGAHFNDLFKLPNHPTFSNQSKYHNVDGWEGGDWQTLNSNNQYVFTPGSTNTLSKQGLLNYMFRNEPNNVLIDLRGN